MVSARYGISNEVFQEREKLKAFYNNAVGRAELCDIIRCGGLLGKIPAMDESKAMIAAHNFAVEKLERLGLLDEEGLEDLVRYLLDREPTKYPSVTPVGEEERTCLET